ncbi:bifunctional diguanylate cyclase/phosphohydrolase [Miltoncostaea marina]|uniref:bifunctional diguanylate cyclase/phosphohydrolase n=1 Tax=Miltoncostaea marina TaxID=2843215 RepID=UPI001C3D07F5|nr:diguanylate cyclase [Miltoncostaea marina]
MRAAHTERRLQAAQSALFVVLAAVVVAVAVWAGRGTMEELHRYGVEQARFEGVSEIRITLQDEETAMWMRRAGGEAGTPLESTRDVLAAAGRAAGLAREEIASEPGDSPERRAAEETVRALDDLVRFVATTPASTVVGSAADRRYIAALAPIRGRLVDAADRWAAADGAELRAANADLRATLRRLMTIATAVALAGVLVAGLGWLLIARVRRRVVGALQRATVDLRRLAETDPLTGLANQRTVHDTLRSAVPEARASGRPLSAVMLDLDHFKRINDTHGHAAGDAVLVETARRLTACSRADDLVARIGGEEFLMLLPGTDGAAALAIAERVRAAVVATPFGAATGHLTVSLGVATLGPGLDADALLGHADTALYWAKAHGRNAAYRYGEDGMRGLAPVDEALRRDRAEGLVALRALARAIDARDAATQRHSVRVADMAVALAAELGWSPAQRARLREAGLVHDVGKIGIPDAILLKPGRLDDAEWKVMQGHAALSARIVAEALDGDQVAWVAHHHERWAGGGYPDNRFGEDIPEGARILALADAWDAMTTMRDYAYPLDRMNALAECRRCSGTHFWPAAVRALEALHEAGRLAPQEPREQPALA